MVPELLLLLASVSAPPARRTAPVIELPAFDSALSFSTTPFMVSARIPAPAKISMWKLRYRGLSKAELIAHTARVDDPASSLGKSSDGAKLPPGSQPLLTQVEVVSRSLEFDPNEGFQRPMSQGEVETSAGTFGDMSRFLQTLAGVTGDNDQRNDVLVRGGNPAENLFLIDNIEVPSINQLALSDTTGGLVSMLDANAIQQITLHEDAYDSKFDERLSSVVDISTRPMGPVVRHVTSEVGIAGSGGSMTRPLGENGSLFVSARRSMVQYFTHNIGIDGVPTYNNEFVRAEKRLSTKDNVWGISLAGVDSILIQPDARDPQETNPFQISYSGWRDTTGVNWQHMFSPRFFGVASMAYAAQSQSIVESGQLQNGNVVYNENTHDGISNLKYDAVWQPMDRLGLTGGARVALDQIDYEVAQPVGLQNPYTSNPSPINQGAFSRQFSTGSSAAYLQGTLAMGHGARLVLGERAMNWALGGHFATTGKALLSAPLLGRMVHIGYSELEQMPSNLYLLSFNNLSTLKPIKSRQETAGIILADNPRSRITLEAYNKNYSDYPVAANIPQLSLANVADTFGQAFLMFPMVARGRGHARGVELTVQNHTTSRVELTGTLTYSRSLYTGLDGVWRRGNFDLPLAANLLGVWNAGRGVTFSWRYSATSGKVYTPDNMTLSSQQNRDVYDLTQVNGDRSSAYSRLDFRLEHSHKMGNGVLTWHAGLQNALDRKNFYMYMWQPHLTQAGALKRGIPYGPSEQDQMPLMPDGGVKYFF